MLTKRLTENFVKASKFWFAASDVPDFTEDC